jgi:hypothetical protein
MIAGRKAGETHPFELGSDVVARCFKVTDECAQRALQADGVAGEEVRDARHF